MDKKQQIIKKGDVIIILLGLLLVAITAFALWSFSSKSKASIVSIKTKEKTMEVSMDKPQTIDIVQNGYEVQIEIQKDKARFKSSTCPDKLCVKSGWLSKNGQIAACLPAEIILTVKAYDQQYDAIM